MIHVLITYTSYPEYCIFFTWYDHIPRCLFFLSFYICKHTKKLRELRNNQGTFSYDLFGLIINYLCDVWFDPNPLEIASGRSEIMECIVNPELNSKSFRPEAIPNS
jgi:hypothetical protein